MRKNKALTVLMLCLCLAWATGCAALGGGDTASSSGAAQVDVPSDEPLGGVDPLDGITSTSRVVALSRSLGEMWLLAGGQLVGITDDGMELPDLSEGVESVGTLADPDKRRVLNLEPDLVLLSADIDAHAELYTGLAQAQVPVLSVEVESFDDYAQVMATFTQVTGRDDLYERNVTKVQAQIDKVIQNASATDESTYMVLRVSPSTTSVLYEDSFVCGMLHDMGLTNAAADGAGLGVASIEGIAKIDPDRIFVIFEGDESEAEVAFREGLTSNPAWSELTAAKNKRVVVLPQRLFLFPPNDKWGQAYSYVSQLLHGSWA